MTRDRRDTEGKRDERALAYGDPVEFEADGRKVKGTVCGLMADALMVLYDGVVWLVPNEEVAK